MADTQVTWLRHALATATCGALVACCAANVASAAPALDLSRSAIAFGYVSRNTTSPVQPVFVTNTGDAPLTVSAVTLGGWKPGEFAVAGTCSAPLTLAPGDRCRIDATMNPSGARGSNATAEVAIQSNAQPGSAVVVLSGSVDPVLSGPIFVPSPGWLDFPAQPVNATSPPLTMTITNATTLAFTIEDFALRGEDAADFALGASCAIRQSFLPGQSCTATVRFAPRVAGPRSTELVTTLSYFSASGTVRYSVTGVGSGGGASTTPSTIVEFYNASLDHYFITWLPDEIAALDAGTAIRGWQRTGQSFRTWATAEPGTSPVCRYYIPPALGDSHFFGRGTVECDATGRGNPSFVLESSSFTHMFLPVAGVCPAGTVQVYRVFSNRPDANHRYLVDLALRDQMAAQGWIVEGDGPQAVVMCAPMQ